MTLSNHWALVSLYLLGSLISIALDYTFYHMQKTIDLATYIFLWKNKPYPKYREDLWGTTIRALGSWAAVIAMGFICLLELKDYRRAVKNIKDAN